MLDLENQLDDAFVYLGIEPRHQESVKVYMNLLKMKDEKTYDHSVRVGLKGIEIAEYMGLDPKALFFPGDLHDIGKIFIDSEILKKTEAFSEEDMVEMKNHPIYAYYILRDIHPFSAEVALRHHLNQEDRYPEAVPKSNVPFSAKIQLDVDYYAMLLSLADYYDAATTRCDNKSEGKMLSQQEIKNIFISKKLGQRKLIEELYDNGIFGVGE